MIGSMDSCVVR